MVFGPVLDALAARKRGVSTVQVLSEGNRQVSLQLSEFAKLAFWLTNVPYWALASSLWLQQPRDSPPAHAIALTTISLVSTAFHGSVLFGPLDSHWPRRLLTADILAANAYGMFLATLVGFSLALRYFGLPLVLLAGAARAKRRGSIATYAWCHGVWHVLSCAAMWRCLQHIRAEVQGNR